MANKNIVNATNKIVDPIDEMMFRIMQASVQSEYRVLQTSEQCDYRRSIRANPRKCWGNNVMFTPVNIKANWVFNQFGFISSPVNSGNHWTNTEKIANTALVDGTEQK